MAKLSRLDTAELIPSFQNIIADWVTAGVDRASRGELRTNHFDEVGLLRRAYTLDEVTSLFAAGALACLRCAAPVKFILTLDLATTKKRPSLRDRNLSTVLRRVDWRHSPAMYLLGAPIYFRRYSVEEWKVPVSASVKTLSEELYRVYFQASRLLDSDTSDGLYYNTLRFESFLPLSRHDPSSEL